MRCKVLQVSQVQEMPYHEKYLTLSTFIGCNKIRPFELLKKEFGSGYKVGRKSFLLRTGKEILIKEAIQSIPCYTISLFKLSKKLCLELHSLMVEFWWSNSSGAKSVYWLSWDKLCYSKKKGGLGFRLLDLFNEAC